VRSSPEPIDGITVNAIAGTHVVTLGLDLTEERRGDCLGFAIQREDHTEDERTWMTGMKTFEATDPKLGGQVSSREHPFQSFQWADYAAKPDHHYTYTVIPLKGSPQALEEIARASVEVHTESELGATHSVFFNRGSVATQEYARRFQNKAPDELEGGLQVAALNWLQRGLLDALKAFIARANGSDFAIHGAIYEFQRREALEALRDAAASGAEVHIVYDGIEGEDNPVTKNNAAIDEVGIRTSCDCRPRTSGDIMHNKFLVLSQNGTPIAVWTGSTNWTLNGIFGQMNCGHVVEDETTARAFLEYWTEIGKNAETKAERVRIGQINPRPPDPDDADLTAVFSPHSGGKVLEWYRDIAKNAGDALFMTFAFGMNELFKGVYRTDDRKLRIALMENTGGVSAEQQAREAAAIKEIRQRDNVLVAVGNHIETNSFDRWLAELPGMGKHVDWVHTKFMLVDPLSEAPTIITGSANFSTASTSTNNENMLVIRGDKRAADIYLGEFMRLYSHYAFRDAVGMAKANHEEFQPQFLKPDPSWQDDYFEAGSSRSLRRQYFARGKLDQT
jgi:phosphatidylserine/phosphatidylglycerophosphate/cardiolipin synthase-like enzyme